MPAFFSAPYSVFLPLASLAVILVTLIIALACIWRTQKRLGTFLKLLTVAVVLVGVRKISNIVGFVNSSGWLQTVQYIDLATSVLLFLAFVEMFRIIRSLDNEKK